MSESSETTGSNRGATHGAVGGIRLFGVPVRFHFTFVLLVIFLLFFGLGNRQSGLATAIYILALFGSVLLHEVGHAVCARAFGISTVEIVMYPIGGVSNLKETPKPKQEVVIAAAGPAVNLIIGGALWLPLMVGHGWVAPERLVEASDANLMERIAVGNLLLAAFNLLPAFPMDGGRILRAALALFRPQEEATRIATQAGKILAVMMGLYGLITMHFFLVFISFFVYLGAMQESLSAEGRHLLHGVPVRDAMITDFRTLSHGDTIRDAATLLLDTSQQDFPVVLGGTVVGLLGRNALLRAMATEGPEGYVAGAMDREFLRLAPDADLETELPKLAKAGTCALVMQDDELLGMLTAENLSEFLVLRRLGLTSRRPESREIPRRL